MPPDVFMDFTLEVFTVNSLKMEYKFETVFFFFFSPQGYSETNLILFPCENIGDP